MLKFTKIAGPRGSGKTTYNVDYKGVPVGQLWTWKIPGENHPWHVKPLKGDHAAFYGRDAFLRAKIHIAGFVS